MNAKRKKSPQNPKLDALATVESQSIAAPSPDPEAVQKTRFSEATEKAFSNWMKQVFGTEDRERGRRLDGVGHDHRVHEAGDGFVIDVGCAGVLVHGDDPALEGIALGSGEWPRAFSNELLSTIGYGG